MAIGETFIFSREVYSTVWPSSNFDGSGQKQFAISKWEFSVAGLHYCIFMRRDSRSHEM